MIVGTSKIDDLELSKHIDSTDDFKQYCISLVPEEFRHLEAIISNQMYICCLYLRRSNRVSWDIKKDIINEVLREVHIVGCTNELINVTEILMYLER